MRRADRLFDIIQALRTAPHPVTASALAEQLEVTTRTIYRDIAALQGSRVPIEGAPGLGYVLRRGFDLPPLMFSSEEAAQSLAAAVVANEDLQGRVVAWAKPGSVVRRQPSTDHRVRRRIAGFR